MLDSVSFFRIIKSGAVNFWRNLWLSTAASMVMSITLVILSILFLMFAVTNYSIRTIQNTVDISVYFKSGLADERIQALKQELEADPKVREVVYTSSEKALAEFREKHKDDPLISQSLNELNENPLPATLNIKARDLEDYPEISESLKDAKYQDSVAKVNFEDNRSIIERLGKILRYIITFGAILAGIFSLIAVLVIYNTITLTIYNRKEEVEIMRLVGATNWYIRGPFVVESLLYAITATVITSLLFFPIFDGVLPKITMFVNPEVTLFNQNIFNFWYLVLMMLLVSVFLAVFSTLLAIRRYMKV